MTARGAASDLEAEVDRLTRRYEREHRARLEAESISEEVTRRLYDSVRELESTNADLSEFAYVASHDLQEPLRMVTGYLQLLSRRYQGQLDDDADEFIGYAVDGAARMQQLIEDLLAYSRVGRKERDLAPTDSADLLRLAEKNLEVAIAEAGATIVHGELPMVLADGGQLLRVFQNLLGNAVKFRGEAAPVVRVGAERTGDRWQVSVSDNGIGIDPQFTERIFRPFRRLHTTAQYPGTGIGLAICRKIVERHGGTLAVISAEGEGATFTFSVAALPAAGDTPEETGAT